MKSKSVKRREKVLKRAKKVPKKPIFESDSPCCVQCHEGMPHGVRLAEGVVRVCTNVQCPNFGILQVGDIGMLKGA